MPLIFPIKIFNRFYELQAFASLGWLGNEFSVFLSHYQTALFMLVRLKSGGTVLLLGQPGPLFEN